MQTIVNRRVLVLNRSWSPVSIASLKDAICLLFGLYDDGNPKARVIDPQDYQQYTWSDWTRLKPVENEGSIVTSGGLELKIPEVIILTKYDKINFNSVKFNRRGVYIRDQGKCQYCGKKKASSELSIDHILPKSRNGATTWENCVLSCVECNYKKRDRLPHEAGMKLIKEPVKPKYSLLDGCKPIKSWNAFISEIYWTVSLED